MKKRQKVTAKLEKYLLKVGWLAWNGMKTDSTKVTFTMNDFKEGMEEMEFCITIGLLTKQECNLESDRWGVNDTFVEFFHKLGQEYCVAYYLSKTSAALNEAMKIIKEQNLHL